MPNTLLTPQMITRELIMRFKNKLVAPRLFSHEYDSQFAREGGKIGDTLKLRKPVKYVATNGANLVIQDTIETEVPLVIDQQRHVGIDFSSRDLTLSIEDFGSRYLESAAVALANELDVYLLTKAMKSSPNLVGTPGITPAAAKTYLLAGAKLDNNAAPVDDARSVIINPNMQAEIVDGLKGLFNPNGALSDQYVRGRMGKALGLDWYMDQNTRTFTEGTYAATAPLVNGAGQTGSSLVTDGWTAGDVLNEGSILTIDDVLAVNPVSGDLISGEKRQFVVTATATADGGGNMTIPIYPAMTPSGAYKTISATAANNAPINLAFSSAVSSPQGLAFHPDAFCWGMVPLQIPQGVDFAAMEYDEDTGVAMRIIRAYNINTDQFPCRADIIFGAVARRPEWITRIAS